jgi:hypothetical protein
MAAADDDRGGWAERGQVVGSRGATRRRDVVVGVAIFVPTHRRLEPVTPRLSTRRIVLVSSLMFASSASSSRISRAGMQVLAALAARSEDEVLDDDVAWT